MNANIFRTYTYAHVSVLTEIARVYCIFLQSDRNKIKARDKKKKICKKKENKERRKKKSESIHGVQSTRRNMQTYFYSFTRIFFEFPILYGGHGEKQKYLYTRTLSNVECTVQVTGSASERERKRERVRKLVGFESMLKKKEKKRRHAFDVQKG